MKASILITAGLGLMSIGLAGCATNRGDQTRYVDARTDKERAAACVAAFEPEGRAPQIMTYDSKTGTEVHMNQTTSEKGRPQVDVTAQNEKGDRAFGMSGEVGGPRPMACTDDDPLPKSAIPKDRTYKTTWNSVK